MTREWKVAELSRRRAAPRPTTAARRVSEPGCHGERCGAAPGHGPATDGGSGSGGDARRGAAGAEGRGTDLLLRCRSLLRDVSRGAAGTGTGSGTGSGSGSKGRGSRSTPGLPPAATCSPQPPPEHVRGACSFSAALHGAGAKTHFALGCVFFFSLLYFFFFPPLNLARAKPEATSFPPLRTQRVTTPTAGRAGSRRGENPSGRRTRSTGELRPAKRPLTYCPGSAEPQTLYAASRELPTRAAGQRQAQAAPAPPLRLPPLRLPIYIHLPAAGGARTVYSSSAAGSSQLGTSPPARRYICGRRRDARGPGRSPLPARRGRPRPRAVAGVPQLLGVTAGLRPGRALGAPCKPAEHPAGLKSVKCGVQGLRNCPGRGRG